MLLKSLVMSVVAAVLGPTIGVAMFLMANSDGSDLPKLNSASHSQEAGPATGSGQTEVSGAFLPQAPWLASAATGVQERKPETAAAGWSTELGMWQTTVSCPEGQPLTEEGPCPSPEIVKAPKTTDVTPAAESLASDESDKVMRRPSRPLPGRMTVSDAP